MKYSLRILLPLAAAASVAHACNDNGTDSPPGGQNKPPVCQITSPEDGAELFAGGTNLIIRGTFSDPEDRIEKVELTCGNKTYDDLAASPFVVQIPAGELTPGLFTISLKVEDDKGEQASHTITVNLSDPGDLTNGLTDARDGNKYEIVQIGEQTWMAENLRYLPQVDNNVATYEPRFYVYKYGGTSIEDAKKSNYYSSAGVFYNFYAALDGDDPTSDSEGQYVRGICPDGWHLPRQIEWEALRDYVADNSMTAVDYAGRPIPNAYAKAVASKEGWQWPPDSEVLPSDGHVAKDPHLNNATGFNGKPVGFLAADNQWYHEGISCGWWTSKIREDADYYSKPTRMWSNDIYFSMGIFDFHISCALPVRCIKN